MQVRDVASKLRTEVALTEAALTLRRPIALALMLVALSPTASWAQKNSGALLSTAPPPAVVPPPTVVPRVAPIIPTAPVAPVAPQAGRDPQVEQLVQSMPIDPATRELTNREPADIRGVERRLGLRETRGPRTDLRGHTPTTREIVDALAPR